MAQQPLGAASAPISGGTRKVVGTFRPMWCRRLRSSGLPALHRCHVIGVAQEITYELQSVLGCALAVQIPYQVIDLIVQGGTGILIAPASNYLGFSGTSLRKASSFAVSVLK